MKGYKKLLLALSMTVPAVSFAALNGLKGLLGDFQDLLTVAGQAVFALALLFFFWGTAQFILNDAANDKTREDGKKKMLWGIIALFIMFSVYGILRMIGVLVDIPVR